MKNIVSIITFVALSTFATFSASAGYAGGVQIIPRDPGSPDTTSCQDNTPYCSNDIDQN